jgi:DNA-binding response OmpR family regulator/signal transduction histidine kinase
MSQNPVRILCIEDNPMNWRLVQRLLGQAGFDMHWAEEGLRGYEMAMELKPDLVLLDINLPGLSGFEVATKLRQQKDLDGTLIVALTAKTMRSDRETALVTGCDGFISKPIDPFHFVDQIKGYLSGRRDKIEQEREGQALRQFSQQVVEHLEAQLKEAQEGNRRLVEAQHELESRNRHLSRLFALTQRVVGEHDAGFIVHEVLSEIHRELGLDRMHLYKVHGEGGYLQGFSWAADGLKGLPVMPFEHPVIQRLSVLPTDQSLSGEDLVHSPFWDPGLELGWWSHKDQGLLLPLAMQGQQGGLYGFLACTRPGDSKFLPHEREIMGLYGGILQASAVNAELIASLNQAHQALAQSYSQAEASLGELQRAQAQVGKLDRDAVLGRLLLGLQSRLEEALQKAKSGDVEAAAQAGRLFQSILRRADRVGAASPEWIDLHTLLEQEAEILRLLEHVPKGFTLQLSLDAPTARIFGMPSDFCEVLGHLVQHGTNGLPPGALLLRTSGAGEAFELTFEDHGPMIPEEDLSMAFEPFFTLRESSEGRHPSASLAAVAQLMGAYGGTCQLESTPERTVVHIRIPLEAEA